MDRRTFLRRTSQIAALGAAGGALGVAIEAHGVEAGRLAVRDHAIAFCGAQAWTPRSRLRVAQLSDVHVGWGTPAETLLAAQRAAWLARPDLLVLTGDYVNRSLGEIDALRAWVAGLPRPCVATLGNHDHWSGAAGLRRMFEAEGVPVLVNSHLDLDLGGRPLVVVGVDDGFTHRDDPAQAFRHVAAPDRALVLSHEPRAADRIGLHGGRLVLSGHTHGGQFVVPGLTSAVTGLIGMRYIAGWYQAGEALLYVNAGVGASVRVPRVGAQAVPELSVFDLAA